MACPAVAFQGENKTVKFAIAGYTLAETFRETQSANLVRGVRDADRARVVVKMLRAEHPTGAQMARLRHEHALLSGLDLPGVVRTLGLVKHGRGEALVLEDLGDRSVESLFRERRPSLAEFLDIAIGMAGRWRHSTAAPSSTRTSSPIIS